MESDGGEREEWWTVMNGGWGVGWGLMKGEGVLLGRHHPCACSSSMCPLVIWGGGRDGECWRGSCWAIVIHGCLSSVGEGSWLAMCASQSSVRGCPACGHLSCVGGMGVVIHGPSALLCGWALSVVGAGWSFCSWPAVVICGC